MARLTVTAARFQLGDFPMVCARSGHPAQEMHDLSATARSGLLRVERIVGRVPFVPEHASGVRVTWNKKAGTVTLHGVHPRFVAACR